MILKPNVQTAISGQQAVNLHPSRDGRTAPPRIINWNHRGLFAISATSLIGAMVMALQHAMTVTLSHPMCWGSRGWIRKVLSSTVQAPLTAARVMIRTLNAQPVISGHRAVNHHPRDGVMGQRRTIRWHHLRQFVINAINLIEATAMARQHVMIVMAVAEAEVAADMFWGSRGWIPKAHNFTAAVHSTAVRVMI